jgi:hypothetical protein
MAWAEGNPLVVAVVAVALTAGMAVGAMPQEDAVKKESARKEQQQVVIGVVVDGKGSPIKDQAVEMLMVGSKDELERFPIFPVNTKTDANGQFKLEMPEYMFVPSGLKLSGFTVGIVTGTQVKALSIAGSGKVARIALKPATKKIDLGRVTLK